MKQMPDGMAQAGWRSRDYVVRPARRQLCCNGRPVHVEERVFDLLALLVSQHHRAVQQREIIASLWGRRPVGEATLRQVVYKARRALGDDGNRQSVIRTLHGRSLQWVAPVEPLPVGDGISVGQPAPVAAPTGGMGDMPDEASTVPAAGAPVPYDPPAVTPTRARLRRAHLATLAAALLLAAVVAAWTSSRPALPPPRVAVGVLTNATGDPGLDWVRRGLPGLIDGVLEQAGGVRVVDPSPGAGSTALAPVVDAQVTGVLARRGGGYALRLLVRRRGRSPDRLLTAGPDPGTLAVQAAMQLRRLLMGVSAGRATPAPVSDGFAAESYARGMDLATRGRPGLARPYFRICVDAAPAFLPGWLRLGVAQLAAGDRAAARRTLHGLLARATRNASPSFAAEAGRRLDRLALAESAPSPRRSPRRGADGSGRLPAGLPKVVDARTRPP